MRGLFMSYFWNSEDSPCLSVMKSERETEVWSCPALAVSGITAAQGSASSEALGAVTWALE